MNLKEEALKFGIELSKLQIKAFEIYAKSLLAYNENVNLTAITDEEEIKEKHFLDSLTLVLSEKLFEGCSMIDIGAGGGFPSIPVKIARPDIKLTMLDSLNKRVAFLKQTEEKLGFTGSEAIHARAEEAARKKEMREKYDIATARAVADLSVLAEYALPFVKTGGYFVAMKGAKNEEELEKAKNAIKRLGGKTEKVLPITLPSGIEHSLIIIKKITSTPSIYPRKAGKPAKDPII